MKRLLLFIFCIFFLNFTYAQDSWQPMNTNDLNRNAFLKASKTHLAIGKNKLPYVAYKDDWADGKGTVQKFNGVSWELVGVQGFSPGTVDDVSIAVDQNNIPYVAYKNNLNSKIIVQKFNGTTWTKVGNEGFSIGSAEYISIIIDKNNIPYVAYSGRKTTDYTNKLTVQKYNGTDWELVGLTRFSEGSSDTYSSSIAIDNNNIPFIAYKNSGEAGGYKSIVQKFNGTGWETLGSPGFSEGFVGTVSLALDHNNVPYVSYLDVENSYGSTVQKFNGTAWELVGKAGFSAGQATEPVIAIDKNNLPYIAYRDEANASKIRIEKFNGTDWNPIGTPGLSAGAVNYVSIAIDDSDLPYVVYKDAGKNNNTVVTKFNGTNWEEVGPRGISEEGPLVEIISSAIDHNNVTYVAYSDPKNLEKCTVQKYNGKTWEIVGKVGFSIGQVNLISIAIDNNNVPYVAYKEGTSYSNGKCTVQKFNGTSWELLGIKGFSPELAGNLNIAIDHNNIPYVAYTQFISAGVYDAVVQKFNGSTWIPVGTLGYSSGAFSETFVSSIAIDNNNIPYVCFLDSQNFEDRGTIKRFKNNSWETLGTGKNYSFPGYIAIDSNNIPYVLNASSSLSEWNTIQKFNGTSWEIVGSAGFCKGEEKSIAIDHNNVPYIFYCDQMNNSKKSTVRKFNGTSWELVGAAEFSQNPIYRPLILINNKNVPIVIYCSNNDNNDSSNSIYAKYFGASNTLSTSTPTKSPSQKINLFPNPVRNSFSVSGEETVLGLEIFDLLGKSVYKSFLESETYNIESLPKGIYVIKIQTEKGSYTMKIIKE
ncbi:T9SS type A sorting domain-containing protein [Flavobacterium sp. ENC]|uniref:T9SS type A sorting domain-containing protein n=1 Tax=Flavobacterium sp. ENC TaxID=2897330 RepID=UPI001E43318D|nr:T9SS type A sorting domain-containing protein [Flavobacterium sp. ENC]MCD0463882.1 T9SS type A sorting domain-containing protein [Flavobacterium sp. ENC]